MRRRQFIAGLGSAAAWPVVARAQRPATIGLLTAASLKSPSHADGMVAVRQGLKALGYVEGQNLRIEYREAEGQYDHLPELAADLVQRWMNRAGGLAQIRLQGRLEDLW